jgi:hypothetical protein
VCCLLFLVEFVGDKIPIFDLVWNAAHTFVRIPVAALLAYAATSGLPPQKQILATLLGGLIAFLAHGGKMAARAAVTHSPEPFSNVALSLGEDTTVIFLTWLATQHPYAAATIVLVALGIIVVAIRAVVRALRKLLGDADTLSRRMDSLVSSSCPVWGYLGVPKDKFSFRKPLSGSTWK